MKRAQGLFVFALLVFSPGVARADDEAAACSSAHLAAQKDRRDHRLTAAKADLLTCARATCPILIRGDCADWLVQVEAETPSIVVDARAPGGSAVSAARALIDGRVIAEVLDGTAIEIDPGPHVLRVEAAGKKAADRSVVVLAGARAQRLTVVLEDILASDTSTSLAASPERRSSSPSVLPLALAGVGVVGLGLFSGFGIAGLSTKADLDATRCAPSCDHESVDRMRRDFAVADVSLLVGLGAFTVAGILWALRATADAPPRSR